MDRLLMLCSRHHFVLAILFVVLASPALADYGPGVTLYRDAHFQGRSQIFYDGARIPALGSLAIGNDSVSSVRVDPGCRVTLYADSNFRGSSVTLTEDLVEFGNVTGFGNDKASSMRVECRRPGFLGGGGPKPGYYQGGPREDDRHGGYGGHGEDGGYGEDRYDWHGRRGVILYSDEGYRGRQEAFYDADWSLKDNAIRQDSISSLRLAPGCRVVLYEDVGFRGRATLFEISAPSLRSTEVGNDRASSMQIECRRYDGGGQRERGVTLYEDTEFEGRRQSFRRDDRRLDRDWQDCVSSVRVAPGCVVVLYEHEGYRGRSVTLRSDVADLRETRLGNDTVSSIRVECRRRGRRR